ncbi:MAG: hypothetical protein Q4G43_07595 [Mobilicoccus sp.]|nr:hypothetical protein [Mobilicoccus sp.]
MTSPADPVSLTAAADAARTGDLWLFRGSSGADRAIRLVTNAPVNHVGMAVVLDDLPPLMWHAELGKSLVDLWTGSHHRGAQLHDLVDAVTRWSSVYGQQVWVRQLHPEVGSEQDDAFLRTMARWNGTSFPSTASLAWRWLQGRRPRHLRRRPRADLTHPEATHPAAAYCAEIVAVTYEQMGILEPGRDSSWYDPGRFWSGDVLPLRDGWSFGPEVAVDAPAPCP